MSTREVKELFFAATNEKVVLSSDDTYCEQKLRKLMKKLNSIKLILRSDHSIDIEKSWTKLEFSPYVVSQPQPLLIKDNLTINEVAVLEQKYLTPAHLSEEAKLLYHTIKSFDLILSV